MALFRGKAGPTVKAAKAGGGSGRTRASARAATEQQEAIGRRYTGQKHQCTTGANGCDSPCPLAHPVA
jgi:hypothetical protein